MIQEFDAAVIGSGAGGAAVAWSLTHQGLSVALIEKGGPPKVFPHAMESIGRYYAHGGYHSVEGNILCSIPTGISLGGTTTINSGTCLKTPTFLLEKWQQTSQGRFKKNDFEFFLDQAWTKLNVHQVPEHLLSLSCRLILQSAQKLNLPEAEPLYRGEKNCQGAGRCCFVCPNNAKMTSTKAFLEDDGHAKPVILAQQELIDLERPEKSGSLMTLRLKSKETSSSLKIRCRILILSCGSLATPYFVRRFHLGKNWRRAGQNLSIHPAAKLFGLFNDSIKGWQGVPQAAGFKDPENDDIRYEGVYTPPELAALTMPLESKTLNFWMNHYDQVATFAYMIKDSSRGQVRYPLGPEYPIVTYNMNKSDQSLMRQAALRLAQVFLHAGATQVVLPINQEDNIISSQKNIQEQSSWSSHQLQTMAFHPLGTCAMGHVVDENLQLEPNIYISDGSVIPESLGVNPQITIYAFALRLAQYLNRQLH